MVSQAHSELGEIIQAFRGRKPVTIVCGTCGIALESATNKVAVNDIIYCEEHARAAAKTFDAGYREAYYTEQLRSPTATIGGIEKLKFYHVSSKDPHPSSN